MVMMGKSSEKVLQFYFLCGSSVWYYLCGISQILRHITSYHPDKAATVLKILGGGGQLGIEGPFLYQYYITGLMFSKYIG